MIFLGLFKESILFAISALLANKLRTFLSLLGITIGIFAIITVFTVVDSLEQNLRKSVQMKAAEQASPGNLRPCRGNPPVEHKHHDREGQV